MLECTRCLRDVPYVADEAGATRRNASEFRHDRLKTRAKI
jgi:hypothetical protein